MAGSQDFEIFFQMGSGFSNPKSLGYFDSKTAETVSDVSGRGVGMDAMRKFVEKLGGTIEVHFKGELNKDTGYQPFESWIILPSDLTVKVA